MFGPRGMEVLLLLFLGTGSSSNDAVSLLNAESYFKARGIELSLDSLLELAGRTPSDGKTQVMQLLAIRTLADDLDEVRKDKRARALLEQIADGKKAQDPQGFAKEYARRTLAKLDGKPLSIATMPKDSVRGDALKWFPQGVALVAAFDLRPTLGIKPEETNLLQTLVGRLIGPGGNEKRDNGLYDIIEKLGNMRVDRASLAFAADPQKELFRIYVRVTGKMDPKRLIDLLRTDMKDVAVQEQKGPKQETITLVTSARAPGFAFIDDTEMIIAGFLDDRRDRQLDLVHQMLDVRAGKQPSVLKGELAGELKKINSHSFFALAGTIPEELLRELPIGEDGPLRAFPRQLALELTRKTTGIDVRFDSVMKNAEEARIFNEDLGKLVKEGIRLLKEEAGGNLSPGTIKLLTQILTSIKIEIQGKAVNARVHIPNEFFKVLPELMRGVMGGRGLFLQELRSSRRDNLPRLPDLVRVCSLVDVPRSRGSLSA